MPPVAKGTSATLQTVIMRMLLFLVTGSQEDRKPPDTLLEAFDSLCAYANGSLANSSHSEKSRHLHARGVTCTSKC